MAKHINGGVFCFLYYCCIRCVNPTQELRKQRDSTFRFSKAHYSYKGSGEMSQQASDVITTRKCIFKKIGP